MKLKELLVREIPEGSAPPRGWGLGYWNNYKRTDIVFPVPLNIIVVILRWWYWRMFKPLDKIYEEQRKWYKMGYDDGFKYGVKSAPSRDK